VHCLILRGEQGTVIRRWSPHTRLNGATFTDALLQPGDRLSIGPVELDVISTGQTVAENSQTSEVAAAEDARFKAAQEVATAAYSKQLAELNEREAALQDGEANLAEQLAVLATQRSELETAQAAHRLEQAARLAESEALAHELNNLRQLQQDLPDLLEDRQQFENRKNQISAGEKELAAAQARFQADSATREAELAERQRKLDEQISGLKETQQQLTAERETLAKKQQVGETAFAEREADLNRQQLELETARAESEKASRERENDLQRREQAWQDSQTAWAAERAEWDTICHETSAEFQHRQDELERQWKEFAAAQSEFAANRFSVHHLFDAGTAEEACNKEAIEALASEDLSQSRESIANGEEHLLLQAEVCQAEEQQSVAEAGIQPDCTEPTTAGDELDRETTDESADEDSSEPSGHGELEGRGEDSRELESEAPAFEEPVNASPAETSGLMERLRAMTRWEDDEEVASEKSSSSYDQLASSQTVYAPPNASSSGQKPKPSEAKFHSSLGNTADDSEKEESIEDYMAKLMNRVRGASEQPASIPASQRSVPQPSPVYQSEPEPEPLATEQKRSSVAEKPFEMSPRQTPTELTSNLAAMRELANFSARDAIDTSVRNRWSQAAIGKFMVTTTALLCGGLLLYWTKDLQSLPFMGASIALVIALFWGMHGIMIVRNVWRANRVLTQQATDAEAEVAGMREMLYAEEDNSQQTEERAESETSSPESMESSQAELTESEDNGTEEA
jgi:hypothetical protein